MSINATKKRRSTRRATPSLQGRIYSVFLEHLPAVTLTNEMTSC